MAVVQISRIQIRRGQKNQGSGVPQLAGGEFGWAVDSRELYIGNGSVADVGGYPILEIPGGETRSVEFNWNMFEPGNTTINCGVIQPSQLVIEGSYGGEPVDSDVVIWTAAIQQQSGLGVLPIIVVVFISAFIGWYSGISKNSCNPYFERNLDQLNKML